MQAQSILGRSESSWSIRERLASGETLRITSPNGPIAVTQDSGSEVVIRALALHENFNADIEGRTAAATSAAKCRCACKADVTRTVSVAPSVPAANGSR